MAACTPRVPSSGGTTTALIVRGVGDCTAVVIAVPFDLIAPASAAVLLLLLLLLLIDTVTTLTTGSTIMMLLMMMMMMTLAVVSVSSCRLVRLQLQ